MHNWTESAIIKHQEKSVSIIMMLDRWNKTSLLWGRVLNGYVRAIKTFKIFILIIGV